MIRTKALTINQLRSKHQHPVDENRSTIRDERPSQAESRTEDTTGLSIDTTTTRETTITMSERKGTNVTVENETDPGHQ